MSPLIIPYDPTVGPVVSVTISDPEVYRAEHELPRQYPARMLIDTGASDSFIAGLVVERLGLSAYSAIEIIGHRTREPTPQYIADMTLHLGRDYELPTRRLLLFDAGYDRIQGIIGREILDLTRFTLDGPNRQFTLEFAH